MKKIFLALLFSSVNYLVFTQSFLFHQYFEDNGLAQNYVNSIAQLPNGFMALGTGNGLSIFDGSKFTNYDVKKGLNENFITCSFLLKDKLYVGHLQAGISVFNTKNNHVKALKSKDILDVKISDFAKDNNDRVYVSTKGKGLFQLLNDKTVPLENELISSINSFEISSKGIFVVGGSDGLFLLERKNNKLKNLATPLEFEYKNVTNICKADYQNSTYWVSVDGEGIYLVSLKNNKMKIIKFFNDLDLNSSQLNITSLNYNDENKKLFISLLNEGVRTIEYNLEIDKFTVKEITKENGLNQSNIQVVYEDLEGNLWLGTFGEGLILKPIQRFTYLFGKVNKIFNNVLALYTNDDNNFLIGNNSGLFSYNLLTNESIKISGIDDQVNCILEDNQGRFWVGTENKGLFILNKEKTNVIKFEKSKSLKSNSINVLTKNYTGKIYIGTKDGLHIYDTKTKDIESLNTLNGLLHNNVKALFIDSKKRLWIGSKSTPPYYLEKGKIKSFNDIDQMKIYNINCYTEDDKGNIWISTEGDGVFSFNGSTFKNFNLKNGLTSNFSYGIINDKKSIWITHKSGISQIIPENNKVTFFNRANNLMLTENNLNSFFKVNSKIYFGTSNGIVINEIDETKLSFNPPILHVNSVIINDKTIFAKHDIEKKYGKYYVRFNFKGVSFSNQKSVKYRYRLIGYDEAWKNTSYDHVEYPKITDGEYIFEVIAISGQGDKSKISRINLFINPPFWMTWWFLILLLLTIIFIVYQIVLWRVKKLSEEKIKLEKLVGEKTIELEKEKAELVLTKDKLAEINHDITDSINYSLNIQTAILPIHSVLVEKLKDVSVFFRPRDIVSGDFYWFNESADFYYFAAVDCSGHGIPGAFMSLIGSTLLHEIILYNDHILPAEMLHLLNDKVIKTLNQNVNLNLRDGMDLSICAIKKDFSQVYISSAGRPVFYFNYETNEIENIKGKPYGIGGSYDFIEKQFENTLLNIKKGDVIYMFSDGYTDQFGSDTNKKFSTKRTKELALKIAKLDADERNLAIEKEFYDWKGEHEQIDDVLMISVRF